MDDHGWGGVHHAWVKNSKWLRNTAFTLFPFFQLDAKIFPRVLYLYEFYKKISPLKGAVVECGIGYSRTFQILSLLANQDKRDVWGFDSFEGFPEPSKEDKSLRNPKKGEWKVMTIEQVWKILEIIRLPSDSLRRTHIIKGFFEDTLKTSDTGPIVFLHLDVDLYQSYKTCLENLYPRVVEGGIVIFDEYDSIGYPGAKKAIDEFFGAGKVQNNYGKYYVIKNK